MGKYFIENRIETQLNKLPDHLIKALIATEDRKFYDHWGVDVTRFIKAMVKNLFFRATSWRRSRSFDSAACQKFL